MLITEEAGGLRPVHSRRAIVKIALAVLGTVGLLAGLAALQLLHDGQPASRAEMIVIALIGAILIIVLGASLLGLAYLERRRRAEHRLRLATHRAERAQDRAEEASKAKTEFVAAISHEIRTPLTGILGYAELLMTQDLSARQRQYVEQMQIAGNALRTIVNDALDLSAIEAGEVRLEARPFSVRTLANQVVSIVSSSANRKGLTIRVHVDPQVRDGVVGDKARLRQILLNLMNNAVKFTDQGEIALDVELVEASDGAATLRFAVRDTGIGIPRDKWDALFKRFSQINPGCPRTAGGTGLGLAISKRLVDLMGGEIGCDSEAGRGSTFWFQVPLGVGSLGEPDPSQADLTAAGRRGRLLVVEDLDQNRELAVAMLAAAGHKANAVNSGAAAVAVMGRERYDLVLMDVQMADMDGLEATRRIRQLPRPACEVPVIAMTANVLPRDLHSCRAAGMNGHLGKPFTRNRLLGEVERWLAVAPAGAGSGAAADEADSVDAALEELHALMGEAWTRDGLRQLRDQLGGLSAAGDDRFAKDTLGRKAHALVSLASMLGFAELSKRCRLLEEVALRGDRIDEAFSAVATAAAAADERIGSLLGEAPPRSRAPAGAAPSQPEGGVPEGNRAA